MKRLSQLLRQLHADQSGAMAVEKILLIALISMPLVIALWVFRNTIAGWFNDQTSKLQSDQGSGVPTP